MLPDEVVAHNRQWEETFQLRAYIVYIDKREGYISWVEIENQPIIRDRIQIVINARSQSAIGKWGLPCRWMGGNIKQVALLLRTSGANTHSTRHTVRGTQH